MKILLVHNRYIGDAPSGENASVLNEEAALSALGHEVVLFAPSVGDFSGPRKSLEIARSTLSGGETRSTLAHLLRDFQPDVMHAHNLYPLIGQPGLKQGLSAQVPIVQTLRNYRHTCIAGTHILNGDSCFRCVEPNGRLSGVTRACYRGSHLGSAVMQVNISRVRKALPHFSQLIAVSSFMADYGVSLGYDRSRISVVPNSCDGPDRISVNYLGPYIYAGRLDELKGVKYLLSVWSSCPKRVRQRGLVIAGGGPLESYVIQAAKSDPTIQFVGRLTPDDLARAYSGASVAIVPSLWDEPFGRAAIEAFAFGLPVIATRGGGLRDIVDDGVGWSIGTSHGDLLAAFSDSAENLERVRRRGEAARNRWQHRYSPQVQGKSLESVYRSVLAGK